MAKQLARHRGEEFAEVGRRGPSPLAVVNDDGQQRRELAAWAEIRTCQSMSAWRRPSTLVTKLAGRRSRVGRSRRRTRSRAAARSVSATVSWRENSAL
ncbi:MAG: hypothetical protein OXU69_06230 [Gemmatimonadota bacterium]|nr:hypothetical protein [Gemmatimonadota bacterium]MDE2984284.1 hypothetical protein [Gemmatimonadota bacterium]